jgi:hypothetical protein
MHIQAKFDIQITLQNSDKLALYQNWHEIMKEIQKKRQKNPNLSRNIVFSEILKERTNGVLIIKLNLSVCDSIADEFEIQITDELFLLVKTEIESFVQTKLNWCLNYTICQFRITNATTRSFEATQNSTSSGITSTL